ncbi:MAG: EAL domain-containing protein [Gammaproteobacteria bacterium]|nr:MAG: EAL domain-containing protein [Gammaproteobacteria bacterium]
MKDQPLHLTPPQIDSLLESLHRFHHEHGTLDGLLDDETEALLLDGFRRFLEHFLQESTDGNEAARALAEEYFRKDIPFVLLMGGFNQIKSQLIELVASNTDAPYTHYPEIDAIFEHAKRETARHYLLAESATPLELPKAAIRDKLLIRLSMEWMERLRQAICNDLANYPLESAEDSAFARALQYPESLLICLDLKICNQILEEHRLIVQQAGLLYALLRAERHEQAYLAFQELQRRFTQLLNLVGLLYFEGQTNRVNRFFGFLQAALYLPGNKLFCVINLRQLGKLNELYGKEVGNQTLELVERTLQTLCEEHAEWLVYTRGIAGDFYLFALNRDPRWLESVLDRLEEGISTTEHGLPVTPALQYHGIDLSNVTELTTENMHLLVEYLNQRARRDGSGISAGREATEAMFEWLRQRYSRSLDLREKLTEETTEIFIQPLVRLARQEEIHAFEVLGRFREGEGYISAGLFIDDIISMGLVADFDTLVLKALLRHRDELLRVTRGACSSMSRPALCRIRTIWSCSPLPSRVLLPTSRWCWN